MFEIGKFEIGKLAWAVLQPGNLLLLLLLLGLGLALLRRRGGTSLVIIAALGFLVLAVAPVGPLLLRPLEARFPPRTSLPTHIDGIVVLGGGIDPRLTMFSGLTSLTDAGSRIVAAADLARRHPEAKLVLLGGEGNLLPYGYPEAKAALPFLDAEGIARGRILVDDKSRSTHENALFGKALVRPEPGQNWLLVTSAWHMPRAVATFRAVGWPAIPYPVDFRVAGFEPGFSLADGLGLATLAAKEWLGLAYYRLLGWTRELLPAPEPAATAR